MCSFFFCTRVCVLFSFLLLAIVCQLHWNLRSWQSILMRLLDCKTCLWDDRLNWPGTNINEMVNIFMPVIHWVIKTWSWLPRVWDVGAPPCLSIRIFTTVGMLMSWMMISSLSSFAIIVAYFRRCWVVTQPICVELNGKAFGVCCWDVCKFCPVGACIYHCHDVIFYQVCPLRKCLWLKDCPWSHTVNMNFFKMFWMQRGRTMSKDHILFMCEF